MTQTKQTPKKKPVTIGELSAAVGMDVRQLIMDGYDSFDFQEIIDGKLTLRELRQRGPRQKKKEGS